MTRQLTLVKLAAHEQIQGKQRYRNEEKEHILTQQQEHAFQTIKNPQIGDSFFIFIKLIKC